MYEKLNSRKTQESVMDKKCDVDSPSVPLEEGTSGQGTTVQGASEESEISSNFSQQTLDVVAAMNALALVEKEKEIAGRELEVILFIFLCLCY